MSAFNHAIHCWVVDGGVTKDGAEELHERAPEPVM